MNFKKCFFTILFVFSFLLLFHTSVNAGNLKLSDLKYDVTLNSDGSADVTEYWNIKIEDTNTLFKTFEIDDTKYSGIKNVSVVETSNGIRKSFKQIYQEKYHVDKDCFYALDISSKNFEIAWGVHEDDSYARRNFEISYTVIDAVKNYSDCSEFYWQFISDDSAIPADKVVGTIHLPFGVDDINDLRVWAHGPLNGNISKTSNNVVTFNVDNLSSKTMLEVRVVTPTDVFANNDNISSKSMLNSIISEETEWADEANRKREAYIFKQKMTRFFIGLFFILSNIGGIFVAVYFVKKIKKYKLELEKAPNFVPTTPSKYYRDIPGEDSTPAVAAFLYNFKNGYFSSSIPNVFSATMLNLCLKKCLSFEVNGDRNSDITVSLNLNDDVNFLSKDEKFIFDMLSKVSSDMRFTMKDFERYCKKHSEKFLKDFNKIEKLTLEVVESKGLYNSNLIKLANNWSAKCVGFVFLAIFGLPFVFASVIPSIYCAVYSYKLYSRYHTLTQKGVDEKEQWKGLKNYMEDFSMLSEKGVPELVLWERYLVYATAFGISDKVIKQLKVVYPQITDSDYMCSHGYTYLYLMGSNNFSNNFISKINSSVTSTYNSINYSSGSGAGGGFSGGGGGGGGGRSEWAEDDWYCVFL